MKKLFFIFCIGFLLQSCYSYKTVENNASQYEIGKYYRVKNEKDRAVVLISDKNDSTLIVINRSLQKERLAIKSITKAEKRKFSIVRTALIPILYVALVVAVFVVLVSY